MGKEQSSGTIDQVWVAPATSSISGWATLGTPSRHVYAAIWRVFLLTYLLATAQPQAVLCLHHNSIGRVTSCNGIEAFLSSRAGSDVHSPHPGRRP